MIIYCNDTKPCMHQQGVVCLFRGNCKYKVVPMRKTPMILETGFSMDGEKTNTNIVKALDEYFNSGDGG